MSIIRYIQEQSVTTEQTIHAARTILDRWKIERFDRILLVGSGSSFNALHIVAPMLRAALKSPVEVVNPTVLLRELAKVDGDPLVVVLSQSGKSTTSIEVATATGARGWKTIIVTADLSSPIAKLGFPIVPLPIGDEPIGPKTKGFTASIAACLVLAEKLGGQSLPTFAAGRITTLVSSAALASAKLVKSADPLEYIVISGSGRHFGVALEASLKISEIAGIASAAFEPEELLHGRLHGLNAQSCGIMIVADRQEREQAVRTASVMKQRGVRMIILNLTDEPTPYDWYAVSGNQQAPFDAIAATIPFQLLAVELALRKNMVPEDMRYPGLSKELSIKVQVN